MTGIGIDARHFAKQGLARMVQETFLVVEAFDDDHVLTAANGDLETAEAGDELTLEDDAAALPQPDKVRFTLTDAGNTCVVTIRVKIRRFGKLVTQNLTLTADGGGDTADTDVCESVEEVKIVSITGNGASDTLKAGPAGTHLGLRTGGIDKVTDVKSIQKRASAGTTTQVAVSSSTVDADQNAIKVTHAAGDAYVVTYARSRSVAYEWEAKGALA